MIAWWINLHVWVRLVNETILSADEKREEKKSMLRSEDVLNAGLLLLFSCWVVFNSLWPPGLQHTRLPCPTPSPRFAQVSVHCISEATQPFHSLMPSTPSPSIFASIRDLSNESAIHIRWPKYWSFSFSISPSNEYLRLISLKIDWFDLLAVQGTFRSLFQHHISKASILQCSAFFMVQLLQPYMTTGKTIVLTIWTFVSRVMSLLFNTLSRFVIAFLPRSNHLLISWLQSPSAVILEPKKKKSVTTSTFSPSICHDVMGLVAMIWVFLIFSFKPALSLSSFTLIKKLFHSSLLSAIRVVSSAYLRLLMILPPILIPACNSSNTAFLIMCSAYRLNK